MIDDVLEGECKPMTTPRIPNSVSAPLYLCPRPCRDHQRVGWRSPVVPLRSSQATVGQAPFPVLGSRLPRRVSGLCGRHRLRRNQPEGPWQWTRRRKIDDLGAVSLPRQILGMAERALFAISRSPVLAHPLIVQCNITTYKCLGPANSPYPFRMDGRWPHSMMSLPSGKAMKRVLLVRHSIANEECR